MLVFNIIVANPGTIYVAEPEDKRGGEHCEYMMSWINIMHSIFEIPYMTGVSLLREKVPNYKPVNQSKDDSRFETIGHSRKEPLQRLQPIDLLG